MFCIKCGAEITFEKQRFCSKCGAELENVTDGYTKNVVAETEVAKMKQVAQQKVVQTEMQNKESGNLIDSFTSKINSLAGGEGAVKIKISDLFSNVFKHHFPEESEELFTCGTSKTTPEIEDIVTEWPKPWLYSRIAVILITAFLFLLLCYDQFQNDNVLPGIIVLGSFAMPFAVLMFFFEMNVPRNISIFNVVKVFFVGGCASLLVTLVLFEVSPLVADTATYGGAFVVGIIEELGKAAIVAVYIGKIRKEKYLLNGILYGGAVGAGFAAFESAGYAFREYTNTLNTYIMYAYENGLQDSLQEVIYYGRTEGYNSMLDVIFVRGFLSPGGHVAWAAMTGFAMVLVMDGCDFELSMLFDKRFIFIFLIPVILHSVWDMPIVLFNNPYVLLIVLIILAWIVLVVFIDRGLQQINGMDRRQIIKEAQGE